VGKDQEDIIKIKTAISLRILLKKNKDLPISKKEKLRKDIPKSYGDIADKAVIRKATVTKTFNIDGSSFSTTLFKIIFALGYTLIDFAKVYESINEKDIIEFLGKKDD
tara:strand:+ start:768 stop:1091 length:324 start_codon:yes stop_codon:yes gene_type:complete